MHSFTCLWVKGSGYLVRIDLMCVCTVQYLSIGECLGIIENLTWTREVEKRCASAVTRTTISKVHSYQRFRLELSPQKDEPSISYLD